MYNVVLVSGVQQSDSIIRIYMYMSILFQVLSPYRLLRNSEFPVLCNRSLLVTYFMSQTLNLSIPPPFNTFLSRLDSKNKS